MQTNVDLNDCLEVLNELPECGVGRCLDIDSCRRHVDNGAPMYTCGKEFCSDEDGGAFDPKDSDSGMRVGRHTVANIVLFGNYKCL